MTSTAATIPRSSLFDRIMVVAMGRWQPLFIGGVTLILSLIVMGLCALVAGANPVTAIVAIFEGALKGRYEVLATLAEFSAISLTGLAVLIPLRTGFFNIGGQGQVELGALAAVVIGLFVTAPGWIVMIIALLGSLVAGALAAVVPLFLRVQRGASEVTTTIMMNFTCVLFMYVMVTGPLKDPKAFYGTTKLVSTAVRLPTLFEGINAGVLIALGVAVLMYLVGRYTVFGLQSTAVGCNRSAALAGGIKVDRVMVTAVLIGAAIAGLAGGVQILAFSFRVAEGWSKSWGFQGIAVGFMGGNPLGVLVVAFIFAILETGSRNMQAMTGVPAALVSLFQGLPVLIYVGLQAAIRISRWKTGAGRSRRRVVVTR
jgi:general nucleoside transport system permease protein